jgi:carboxypeptidase C (cathepsin A)
MYMQYAGLLPPMLKNGIKVMIYAGDKDLICNWLGNRRWVDALKWDGASGWKAAKDFTWSVAGESAGEVRESGGLSFVKVFDAGHMVSPPSATREPDTGVW